MKNFIRPTFYLDGHELRAGGILFYRSTPSGVQFLLTKYVFKNALEDLGGKTDYPDKSITDTIFREVEEETNGLIPAWYLYYLLSKPDTVQTRFFVPQSKYLLLVVKADEVIANLNDSDFGDFETAAKSERQVFWIPQEQIVLENLNARLSSDEVTDFIRTL